ncbi:MAG: PAS domain S-box protein, partial [Bacteroidales bacterium]
MKKIFVLFIFVITLLIPVHAQQPLDQHSTNKKILMINSYCLLQKWTVDFSDGYIPYIYNDDYEVYMTFLDEKRYPLTKERQQVFYKNLNEFYKNIKFDLVLVTDNPALTFINHYYHDIASIHEVPVFAAGINFFDSSMINNISQTLVIPEYIEPIATIDQILSFFPNLNTIYILNDYTETGNSVQKEIQKKILLHKQRYIGVNFIYNENLAFDEIIEDINSLPKGSAVLLGAYNQDKNGQYFSCEKIPGKLKKIKLPIFCLAQQYQDSSFVGGKMNLAQEQGRLLGEAVQKYFKTHRIPYEYSKIAQDNTKWIFSYPALEKFNLLDRKFDKNAILLNAPDKPYAKYKKQFEIAFFMICLLLISIIISIIYSFVMRKRIIRKTNEIKAKVNVFMDFIEKIPLSYIQFDNENIVTVWNKSAEMLFGYSKKEAIGKNLIDLIIKKEFQEQVLYNQRFFVKDNITYSGSEMNINKYGEEMRCEWYFTFVKDHSNILKETHCIVIDITDKKSAKNDEKILIDKLKTIKTNKERIL